MLQPVDRLRLLYLHLLVFLHHQVHQHQQVLLKVVHLQLVLRLQPALVRQEVHLLPQVLQDLLVPVPQLLYHRVVV